jgi:benzaldehyde dehydrogenase (NAD)
VAIARIFEEAGLPAGVLQVLPGGPEVGESIIADPRVRVVSFTGSTAAGRRVGELAARHLTRAHLELGGNSALVVLPDANVDQAVTLAAFGSFFHQGQICMTTGRHIVHESLYDDYVERLAGKAAHLPVGNPATTQVALGPVIDAGQRDKIHDLVTASQNAGAKVVAGADYDQLFYKATVLADVPPASPAFAEEVFGPVAPVVAYSSVDDAVRIAADTEYGLALGIVTRDIMRGLDVAERIPSGIVHINDQTVSDEANIPFGGVGASGTGARFGGPAANVDAFTDTQWVTVRSDPPPYPF